MMIVIAYDPGKKHTGTIITVDSPMCKPFPVK